jgi:hypothetical protein
MPWPRLFAQRGADYPSVRLDNTAYVRLLYGLSLPLSLAGRLTALDPRVVLRDIAVPPQPGGFEGFGATEPVPRG